MITRHEEARASSPSPRDTSRMARCVAQPDAETFRRPQGSRCRSRRAESATIPFRGSDLAARNSARVLFESSRRSRSRTDRLVARTRPQRSWVRDRTFDRRTTRGARPALHPIRGDGQRRFCSRSSLATTGSRGSSTSYRGRFSFAAAPGSGTLPSRTALRSSSLRLLVRDAVTLPGVLATLVGSFLFTTPRAA